MTHGSVHAAGVRYARPQTSSDETSTSSLTRLDRLPALGIAHLSPRILVSCSTNLLESRFVSARTADTNLGTMSSDRAWLLGCVACSAAGATLLISTPKEKWSLQARGAAGLIVGGLRSVWPAMSSPPICADVSALRPWADETMLPRALPRAAAMLFVPMYTVAALHRGLPKMPILYGLGVLCAVVRYLLDARFARMHTAGPAY
jgi:hypothetical protein